MSIRWSPQDVEIAIGLNQSGIPFADIGNLLGRTAKAVEDKLRDVGSYRKIERPSGGCYDGPAIGPNKTDKQWAEDCRLASQQYTAALFRMVA